MKTLPKQIGDFKSEEELTIEQFKERVKNTIEKLDVQQFLEDREKGWSFLDELELAHYDYLDGGIGSTNLFLDVVENEDGYAFEYGISSELDGHTEFSDNLVMGNEELLFDIMHETVLINTKEYRELLAK